MIGFSEVILDLEVKRMSRQIAFLIIGAAFFIGSSTLLATDRLVPSQYSTIQAAIDDCNDGDVVIVAPGTYTGSGNKNIGFGGKAITVRSTDPDDPCVVAATIIDCENSGRGFYFRNGETSFSVLAGFSITNGNGGLYFDGGAIRCRYNSNPTIRSCILRGNSADQGHGGGVYIGEGSSPTISNCIFTGNYARHRGGAIMVYGCSATVSHCTITGNSVLYDNGAIDCYNGSISIDNCILWGDSPNEIGENTSSVYISYSDVQGAWSGVGNINVDPCFVNPSVGNYHLGLSSPCINAGDPDYVSTPKRN